MKLSGLIPNSHIHISVSDLYIPRIGHRYMNVEIGRQNSIILLWKYRGRAVSFLGIHKWVPDIYIVFSLALHCSTRCYHTTFSLSLILSSLCVAGTVFLWKLVGVVGVVGAEDDSKKGWASFYIFPLSRGV
jgi:hypothetical protein